MSVSPTDIESLVEAAKRQGLDYVKVRDGESLLRIELRGSADAPLPEATATLYEPAADYVVHSTMVGYFRRRADHAAEGTGVTPETTIAIIEALGLPNDVHAGVSGVLDEILVEDGEGVEYGQAIARISRGSK